MCTHTSTCHSLSCLQLVNSQFEHSMDFGDEDDPNFENQEIGPVNLLQDKVLEMNAYHNVLCDQKFLRETNKITNF